MKQDTSDGDLPRFSRVELALGEQVGKVAAPLLKEGRTLEEALATAYPVAAAQLIKAGENRQEVEMAMKRQLATQEILPPHETAPVSERLHRALMDSFEQALKTLREGPLRLDEVKVNANTGFNMILYPNESQHAGFPHVKVQLQDGDINISIEEEPRVVAGKRGLRGEAAALRAVKEHRTSLIGEWHATRPDDQKLETGATDEPPKQRQ